MSYKYNTRHSGRFNTPGQFVSAGVQPESPLQSAAASYPSQDMQYKQQQQGFGQQQRKPPLPPLPSQQQQVAVNQLKSEDTDMESTTSNSFSSEQPRPHWMKAKLPGVKKVSNRERRRRRNESLRRLLTPKNALMVLNEMKPNDQVANQFKVEPVAAPTNQYHYKPNSHSFCADLTLDGTNYKGFGENKLTARNAAAEQAIRDLVIRKLSKEVSDAGAAVADDESLPMIQLASFALHKLFTEWEYEGHKVPQLKPQGAAAAEAEGQAPGARGKPAKPLPANAAAMHPCMLLTYMRPNLEYRELAAEGDRPQNMVFTAGVDVDGTTYIGKASNKKEARKLAAKSACEELLKVQFEPVHTANAPAAPL